MAEKNKHPDDPRGLIHEAFRIEGITAPDCRSIFFDWALGLPPGRETAEAARALLSYHGQAGAAHPMAVLLQEAIDGSAAPRRRGGRASRMVEPESR